MVSVQPVIEQQTTKPKREVKRRGNQVSVKSRWCRWQVNANKVVCVRCCVCRRQRAGVACSAWNVQVVEVFGQNGREVGVNRMVNPTCGRCGVGNAATVDVAVGTVVQAL